MEDGRERGISISIDTVLDILIANRGDFVFVLMGKVESCYD